LLEGANSGDFVTADNTRLSGADFTAQLWVGPESTQEWAIQPVGQTTFRTGADAGLLAPVNPIPVVFALPGQRIFYQLRVWDNQGGTINSWDQVINHPSTRRGATPVYLSTPINSGANSLSFTASFVLVPDFAAPAPVLSMSQDGCTQYTGFFPGIPVPDVHEGEDVTLSVVCPSPAVTVQWSLNGTILPGATSLTLSRPRIRIADAGFYSAVVTAQVGPRTARMTNSMSLSVLPAPRLSRAQLHPTQGFSADVDGVTNRTIVIEYSSDLRTWTMGRTQSVYYAWGCGCLYNRVSVPRPLPIDAQFFRARLLP
jgi:hypothetical protein